MPTNINYDIDYEQLNTLCSPYVVTNETKNISNGKNKVVTVTLHKNDADNSDGFDGVIKLYHKKHIVEKEEFIYKNFGKLGVSPELIVSQTEELPYFHITKKIDGYKHLIVDDKDIWEVFIDKVIQLHQFPVLENGVFPENLREHFQYGQGFLGEEDLLINNLRDLRDEYCTSDEKTLIEEYEKKYDKTFDQIICDLSHRMAAIEQKSLLHGDLHRWNVLQKRIEDKIDVVLVDWEFCGYGASQLDFGSYFYDDIENWISEAPTAGIITGDFARSLLNMYYEKTKEKTGLTHEQFIYNQRICNCYRSFALGFILQTYEKDRHFSIELLKVALHLYFDFLEAQE